MRGEWRRSNQRTDRPKMRPLITGLTVALWAPLVLAQQDTLIPHYAKRITEGDLRRHLVILASDSLQGRDTGREGQKMAADYLRNAFRTMGIPPVPTPHDDRIVEGYYQPYDLIVDRSGTTSLVVNGREHALLDGIVYFNEVCEESFDVTALVCLREAKTLPTSLDLKGRDVLIDGNGIGTGEQAMLTLRQRMEAVRKTGPRTIYVSMKDLEGWKQMVHGGSRMRLADDAGPRKGEARSAQLFLLDESVTSSILQGTTVRKALKKKAGRTVNVRMRVLVKPAEERVTAENVLAYIEGSDKKDELVVLTAHYDHIGVENGVVYNGADDDGSGTVALLEIAEAFATAKREGRGPRRSVLVMPVSGEEKGLLGSRYYSEHPVFPLERTIADLNIDMIGRIDSAHATSAPYVYIIGSDRLSSGLHSANEEANKGVGLQLDYTFNAESDPNRFYYRSDHYNFARKNVPSIFYFSGVHEDYHQPGDDVEKIRFDLLRQRAELVFRTTWLLANQEERIVVDVPAK